MASTMQLEFSQAMSDFKTMFPDMDREVIEAVLRANQGAVDATIDQLLAMSTDNQNEKLRNEMDENSLPQSQDLITLNDEPTSVPDAGASVVNVNLLNLSSSSAAAASGSGSGSATCSPHHNNTGASPKLRIGLIGSGKRHQTVLLKNTLNTSRRWNPPMLRPLPADFLRLRAPGAYDVALRGSDFDLPDEQFALMLQNEEFMNQLRWNDEFMKALEKEQNEKTKTEDDAAFKERLKHMGKVSRKKFLQIARVFTWQRNKKITTAKQIDSLPLKEEPSDDEDHHHHYQYHQHQPQQQHIQEQPNGQ